MGEKRRRMPNLTECEKKTLIDLVTDHFGVVENKRTDAVTQSKKAAEWQQIANAFNALSTVHHRSAENLKASWENMKKTAKKVRTEEKMEYIKTGKYFTCY